MVLKKIVMSIAMLLFLTILSISVFAVYPDWEEADNDGSSLQSYLFNAGFNNLTINAINYETSSLGNDFSPIIFDYDDDGVNEIILQSTGVITIYNGTNNKLNLEVTYSQPNINTKRIWSGETANGGNNTAKSFVFIADNKLQYYSYSTTGKYLINQYSDNISGTINTNVGCSQPYLTTGTYLTSCGFGLNDTWFAYRLNQYSGYSTPSSSRNPTAYINVSPYIINKTNVVVEDYDRDGMDEYLLYAINTTKPSLIAISMSGTIEKTIQLDTISSLNMQVSNLICKDNLCGIVLFNNTAYNSKLYLINLNTNSVYTEGNYSTPCVNDGGYFSFPTFIRYNSTTKFCYMNLKYDGTGVSVCDATATGSRSYNIKCMDGSGTKTTQVSYTYSTGGVSRQNQFLPEVVKFNTSSMIASSGYLNNQSNFIIGISVFNESTMITGSSGMGKTPFSANENTNIILADISGDYQLEMIEYKSGLLNIGYPLSKVSVGTLQISGLSNGGFSGYYNPVCLGTTLTFNAKECLDGNFYNCNYANSDTTERERVSTSCGGIYGGVQNGTYAYTNPSISCPFNTTTGIKNVRLYIQGENAPNDYSQSALINISVINGTSGIDCNINYAPPINFNNETAPVVTPNGTQGGDIELNDTPVQLPDGYIGDSLWNSLWTGLLGQSALTRLILGAVIIILSMLFALKYTQNPTFLIIVFACMLLIVFAMQLIPLWIPALLIIVFIAMWGFNKSVGGHKDNP